MVSRVKSAILDSRSARGQLPVRDKPHYLTVAKGLHLGYRKGKRGGKWVVRSFIHGKYDVETFATADDELEADGSSVLNFWQAQAAARDRHQAKCREALGIDEPLGPYTVARCMADHLDWLREHKKTADDIEYRVNALILPEFGNVECAKLTTLRIRAWHKRLAKQRPRLRTRAGDDQKYRDIDADDSETIRRRKVSANRALTILKAGLNRGWRDGWIPSDHAWRKVEPYRGVEAARLRYLKVDEARRLVNACDPDLRDLVRGALATGARYGELAALLVSDYDRDNGTVHVRQSKAGRGRFIILNDEGRSIFDRITAGRSGGAGLFLKANGQRWLKSHQARPFKAASERAKIDPPISIHVLRHTYASLSIMNGSPLIVIAENLGHSDTRMVEKHYGHLARAYVVETIRATAPTFGIGEESNVERLGAGK